MASDLDASRWDRERRKMIEEIEEEVRRADFVVA